MSAKSSESESESDYASYSSSSDHSANVLTVVGENGSTMQLTVTELVDTIEVPCVEHCFCFTLYIFLLSFFFFFFYNFRFDASCVCTGSRDR